VTTWTNWGRNVSASPTRVETPATTQAVVALVNAARGDGARLRPVGSGHSFTPIAAPVDVQVRLDALDGVLAVDRERRRVRVGAGVPLHVLNPTLERLGLAMPNLGDIDRQTVAGATATGTHGTGGALQGLSAAVCGLTLVTGTGEVLRIAEETNAELLPAARVGLGALGIVTEVELQLVPAFRLHAVEQPEPLRAVLDGLSASVEDNRHFEFYWFPHTDRAQTKRNNLVDEADPGRPLPRWREALDDHLRSNVVFEGVNRVVARRPATAPRVNQVTARALSRREYTDASWRVFCTRRDVRFTESEFAVPRESLVTVLTELRAWVDRSGGHLPFPVEVRFAAADDLWLSTGYERANAYVAVHQYHRMDDRRYFAAFEAIAREHAGRPHWGKLHSHTAEELRALYPRFDDFVAVRDRLDPDRVLANDHLERILGP
jgi:FAD-linked oxidoreductase